MGGLGERWLVERAARSAARPAGVLAPEGLVGMLGARRQPWVFVGESGTTYEAESPLGAFLSSSSPPSRLARVSSGDHNLLGVSETGRLLASEDAGASWHAVGPAAERFTDVLLWPPHGLALAVPERLWW